MRPSSDSMFPPRSLHRATDDHVPDGTRRFIDGVERVCYSGYWIKTYPVPADTLRAQKELIEALTRRLFNHTEHGLNVPGVRLNEARAAYDAETDPAKRRVKGAMLAGALFNRANDIFRRMVDLQADGVEISPEYPLVQECGHYLMEALELGRLVLHRSGEEGIDELWGEPFRLFSTSLDDFYQGRYVKIGLAMKDIDAIANCIVTNIGDIAVFGGIKTIVLDFAAAARVKIETLRTDPLIFDVWAEFVTAGERLANFSPVALPADWERKSSSRLHGVSDGLQLLRNGHTLAFHITRARTPMPKSTREFIERCEFYRRNGRCPHVPTPLPG